ncbi:sigma 54-interacting transcriptional regulator [Bacillus sp. EB106-08-02-XG196]|uniref:sigma 54-interacting transcriptional regulator n=1 Tax=Bacillus sp. EB106-08-02-XG196 TaxID=2737049 RepID=UPI0015C42696|nr:sigma 54-interacting transcriptional regulator [Bacillus sp. EB106-08-02-XG196]NWQ43423.1 sigma 54-interacting transcriptional regulator [Bacillus sp. EB106-08-02-XG196]
MRKNLNQNLSLYKDREMLTFIEKAKSIAKSNSDVLLYGEEGTEKELIAETIHVLKNEAQELPFVTINCSYLPDELFNVELFGKGREEPGLLEKTKDGTIHLEEISELSLFSQSLLLEVIKNRSFRRVGDCSDTKVMCRIIASSKMDLLPLVKDRKFLFELYYLISVLPIHIPPLRNRKEDIHSLANYFVNDYNQSFIYNKKFLHPDTIRLLQSYEWPGNTMELKNVISRAIHFSTSNAIRPKDISLVPITPAKHTQFSHSLKDLLQSYEKSIVEQALKQYKSARKTADILDVSHTTILKKIHKYGLETYLSS